LEGVLLTEEGVAADDGELCVRGSQRFDGYLNPAHDPGRFLKYEGENATITDGSPAPDDWYRTGDRVRVEDGVWVHLSRLDDQVKIRGYRIELGEIESVLRDHPRIHDVVVLALPRDDESIGLYALYTGEPVPPPELTELASRRLPAYMLPQRYVYVEKMPVNVNGKIDRRRLAATIKMEIEKR
jgi:acyl-CoA synthetase (AMP-forming)/AMP-acid ligase II